MTTLKRPEILKTPNKAERGKYNNPLITNIYNAGKKKSTEKTTTTKKKFMKF
jgi:hypothetical protein